mmetsp:Transcript_20732/g.29992  ORF Transcript_20732/g.29992 Transcript_20732/m.29992 type:complete len:326 (-) Transcript_20732:403-1380(-)
MKVTAVLSGAIVVGCAQGFQVLAPVSAAQSSSVVQSFSAWRSQPTHVLQSTYLSDAATTSTSQVSSVDKVAADKLSKGAKWATAFPYQEKTGTPSGADSLYGGGSVAPAPPAPVAAPAAPVAAAPVAAAPVAAPVAPAATVAPGAKWEANSWEKKTGTPSGADTLYGGASAAPAAPAPAPVAAAAPVSVPAAAAKALEFAVSSGDTVPAVVKGGDRLPEKAWETKAGTPSDLPYATSTAAPPKKAAPAPTKAAPAPTKPMPTKSAALPTKPREPLGGSEVAPKKESSPAVDSDMDKDLFLTACGIAALIAAGVFFTNMPQTGAPF